MKLLEVFEREFGNKKSEAFCPLEGEMGDFSDSKLDLSLNPETDEDRLRSSEEVEEKEEEELCFLEEKRPEMIFFLVGDLVAEVGTDGSRE